MANPPRADRAARRAVRAGGGPSRPTASVRQGVPDESTRPHRPRPRTTPPSRFDDHLAAQLLAQWIVMPGTEVDEVSANQVCAQQQLLSTEDPRTDGPTEDWPM
ncbi:hypothetical protein BX265_5686 [Streptomyces sp. TLI_235]|nr:hypothetical protein BX265_5686 [Streptomyces sp. TLI_235]